MKEEIWDLIRERGLLLEKNVLELLECLQDTGLAKEFLLQIEKISGQKYISTNLLNRNVEFVQNVVKNLDGEKKNLIEKTFIKLGVSLEVIKESEIVDVKANIKNSDLPYKIFYANTKPDKKIEVKDFTGHFRARYQSLQRILMSRTELQNLVSIGKISSARTNLSIIGIVSEKRITKNKNLIIRFEDLSGSISALVRSDREEVFNKANELQLDDVVGIKASGNRDMIFIQDIFFPDAFIFDKTRFEEDINIAFLSDVHCGSYRHLGKQFENFLEWINSDDISAKKIKYIFFVGDNVDGVGIFPGQEDVLELKSMTEQYDLLASYLKRLPKDITIFMCPGQHDAVRVAEPQPIIDKRYAESLYSVENLILVTNPCLIKLEEKGKEFKVLMYHGASIHSFINEIKELRDMKAHKCPAKAVRHMLKRRHLAPVHGEVVYIPNADLDPLVINEVPNILCTGEVHRLDIENYNGVLIMTGSCWQSQTPFEEKVGNVPDPCKVPVYSLKTGELKIFDFTGEEVSKAN
ncbi:MAG: metallophosphoesterase [Nanoarchaeota archaeon]